MSYVFRHIGGMQSIPLGHKRFPAKFWRFKVVFHVGIVLACLRYPEILVGYEKRAFEEKMERLLPSALLRGLRGILSVILKHSILDQYQFSLKNFVPNCTAPWLTFDFCRHHMRMLPQSANRLNIPCPMSKQIKWNVYVYAAWFVSKLLYVCLLQVLSHSGSINTRQIAWERHSSRCRKTYGTKEIRM